MPALIDTATMPGDDMSPALIEAAATNFRDVGTKVSARGGTVLTEWQKISAVYEAPEDATLAQAMIPVKTTAESFGTDLEAAAKALDTFADQVRTIKAEVANIRADAASLLGGITDGKISKLYYGGGDYYTGDFDWHTDEDTVNANNALIRRTNDQQEALWAAERACASAIRAAIGLGPVLAADGANPNGYGVAEIPDDAPMPWGSNVERSEGCLEKAGDGLADAGGSALLGLGNMVGINYTDKDGFDWSRSTATDAWGGALKLGVGAATLSLPGLLLSQNLPGPVGRYVREAQFSVPATAASLIGIDLYAEDPLHKWKNDPAHTFGGVLFNAATLPLAVTKVTKAGALGRGSRATPDTPDLPRDRVPDGTGSLDGVDPSDLAGLSQKADLDGSFSIRNDFDPGKPDGDGPPTDRTDTDGPPTDRTDTDDRGSDPADDSPTTGEGTPDRGDNTADRERIGNGSGEAGDPRVYGYDNPAEALRGTAKPDADDLGDLGRSKDYDPGTLEHMQARWQEYLTDKSAKGETPLSWDAYRDKYIDNQGWKPRGDAYEQAYRNDHPVYNEAAGYQFNTNVPHESVKRNYDILNVKNGEAVELKSGPNIDDAQLRKDTEMVQDGWTVRYVFGQQPTAATIRRLEAAGIDYEVFHGAPVPIY